MGIDWENILDARGGNLADTYDRAASAALYEDEPPSVPRSYADTSSDDERETGLDES